MKEYIYHRDSKELAEYVVRNWKRNFQNDNGLLEYIRKSHRYYYGNAWSYKLGTDTIGEQGEFTAININQLRSDIKAIVSMTTQNKIAFDAITTSTNVTDQNNVIIANALLEQMFYVRKIESKCRQLLEQGLVYGTSFMYVGFTNADKVKGVDSQGNAAYGGELEVFPINILDVKLDDTKEQFEEQDSIRFRKLRNRYELMARYPEVAKELETLPKPMNMQFDNTDTSENPDIWVYYTFHRSSKAVPHGRMHICCDDNIILYDDVNPYGRIPVVCYRPAIRFGSAHGHALLWDLFPIQQAMNTLDSAHLTMAENFALPNIVASNVFKATETDMSGGMKLITGASDPSAPNGGFPMAMNMPKPDQAYMQMRQMYDVAMEKVSGVNAASRGQTTSQQSGTAIALAQSAAQVFNSSVESGYVSSLENVADLIILVCKLMMTPQEIKEIAGLSMDYQTKTFDSASLESITRIRVNLGNPLSRTVSGRVEIANQLLSQGLIQSADYMSILLTGDLPKKLHEKASEDMLISSENEMLGQGEAPIMSAIDNHIAHIIGHKPLLANPFVRKDSKLIALIMDHIIEHENMYQQLLQTNPILLDIAMGNPIGTAVQSVPPPQTLQQGQPQEETGADMGATGQVEQIAEKGREMAQRKLESVG